MLPLGLLAAVPFFAAVLAQDEGTLSGPTSSAAAAGYSCDASKCQLPNCNCASTAPPGGLSPVSSSSLGRPAASQSRVNALGSGTPVVGRDLDNAR